MTHRLVIQPEADVDIERAFEWYEDQRSGLGQEFLECVEAALERIREQPTLYRPAYQNVRQVLIRRFPYVVAYVFKEDFVDVIAVFHGRRDPSDWQSRLR